MHLSCALGKEDIVRFLLEQAKKDERLGVEKVYNLTNNLGRSPVFYATTPSIIEPFLPFEDLRVLSLPVMPRNIDYSPGSVHFAICIQEH